jgi:hypothetical protein
MLLKTTVTAGNTMTRLIVLCAFAVALAGPKLVAQATQADEVLIKFEIHKNGALIARPWLRMKTGGEAMVRVDNGPSFTVVPTQTDAKTVTLLCEFKSPHTQPDTLTFKLTGQEQDSGRVAVGKDSFEIKAAVQSMK